MANKQKWTLKRKLGCIKATNFKSCKQTIFCRSVDFFAIAPWKNRCNLRSFMAGKMLPLIVGTTVCFTVNWMPLHSRRTAPVSSPRHRQRSCTQSKECGILDVLSTYPEVIFYVAQQQTKNTYIDFLWFCSLPCIALSFAPMRVRLPPHIWSSLKSSAWFDQLPSRAEGVKKTQGCGQLPETDIK